MAIVQHEDRMFEKVQTYVEALTGKKIDNRNSFLRQHRRFISIKDEIRAYVVYYEFGTETVFFDIILATNLSEARRIIQEKYNSTAKLLFRLIGDYKGVGNTNADDHVHSQEVTLAGPNNLLNVRNSIRDYTPSNKQVICFTTVPEADSVFRIEPVNEKAWAAIALTIVKPSAVNAFYECLRDHRLTNIQCQSEEEYILWRRAFGSHDIKLIP